MASPRSLWEDKVEANAPTPQLLEQEPAARPGESARSGHWHSGSAPHPALAPGWMGGRPGPARPPPGSPVGVAPSPRGSRERRCQPRPHRGDPPEVRLRPWGPPTASAAAAARVGARPGGSARRTAAPLQPGLPAPAAAASVGTRPRGGQRRPRHGSERGRPRRQGLGRPGRDRPRGGEREPWTFRSLEHSVANFSLNLMHAI